MVENNSNSSIIHDTVHQCHICGNSHLDIFKKYSHFHRVTSDCKPWAQGGNLAVCPSCGCVQKLIDAGWLAEMGTIYNSYSIYFQSQGTEQAVFNQISGNSISRSSQILDCIKDVMQLPKTGKHLDIGCGNGALLLQFHEKFPEWTLYGIELNEKYKSKVEDIPSVQKMYVSSQPDIIKDKFNCITMIHVLEHIPNPRGYLEKIHDLLTYEGILVIEVPFFINNPYDLLIADHCTHFSESTLCTLLYKSGFNVMYSSTKCVTKELTVVAKKRNDKLLDIRPLDSQMTSVAVVKCIDWLDSNITDSLFYAKNGCFGIFGTSIAATWLFSEILNSVHFFMDEDLNRIGKTYLGLPVYDPFNAPYDSIIFLPFCPSQARKIKERLEKKMKTLKFVIPSSLS